MQVTYYQKINWFDKHMVDNSKNLVHAGLQLWIEQTDKKYSSKEEGWKTYASQQPDHYSSRFQQL